MTRMSKRVTKERMKDGVYRPSGTRFFWIQFRHGGKTERVSTRCLTRAAAKEERAKKITASVNGTFVPDARKVTYEDLKRFVKADDEAKGNRSRRKWQHLDAAFAGHVAVSITTDRIRAYEAARLGEGAARATVNQELAALRHAVNLAVEAGRLAARPVIKTPDPRNARKGFVTEKQFAAVRDELPAYLRGPWTMAYLTGWRLRSEILSLTWRNVDW